jgi:hypothetical protein
LRSDPPAPPLHPNPHSPAPPPSSPPSSPHPTPPPLQAPGPYDVVVQDLQHQTLLQRLMVAAHASEAQVRRQLAACVCGCGCVGGCVGGCGWGGGAHARAGATVWSRLQALLALTVYVDRWCRSGCCNPFRSPPSPPLARPRLPTSPRLPSLPPPSPHRPASLPPLPHHPSPCLTPAHHHHAEGGLPGVARPKRARGPSRWLGGRGRRLAGRLRWRQHRRGRRRYGAGPR